METTKINKVALSEFIKRCDIIFEGNNIITKPEDITNLQSSKVIKYLRLVKKYFGDVSLSSALSLMDKYFVVQEDEDDGLPF